MSNWFNRKKDPRNIEELMISEYQRMIQDGKAQQEKIEDMHFNIELQEKQHTVALEEKDNTINELKERVRELEYGLGGVVDLHEPTKLYYIKVISEYQLGNLDSIGETYQEKIATIEKLLAQHFDNLFIRDAAEFNESYYKVVSIEEQVFPYKLSVNNGSQITILYYDPANSLTSLVNPAKAPTTEKWCLCDYDECEKYAAAVLRSRLREKLNDFKKEVTAEAEDDE